MLIEFTVGNFKSFRDKTTFSMIAANLTSDDPALDRDNVIPIKKDLRLLKSAAVYGANASGKSNFGIALRFMRQFVLDSSREASTPAEVGLQPFRPNREAHEQPSFFEMIFLINGQQYRYGFEANRKRVVSEWLFQIPKTKEVVLFLREGQEIDVKAGFREGKGLEVRTRPEALFLSVAALFNGPVGQKVQGWFDGFFVTTGLQDDDFNQLMLNYLQNPADREGIATFIRTLDLGIDNIYAPDPLSLATLPNDAAGDEVHAFESAVRQRGIYTVHRLEGHREPDIDFQLFDLAEESQGTQKMVALAGPLLKILDLGIILFVDELDARLHPLMTRRIIEMFHSPLTNPKGAQLIFATHDTNLLDKSLFRRDQIWFAEKDQQGATHLASLAEYRVRNDAAFEKNYLEGRYGAIPFLGDLTRLPWAQGKGATEEGMEREPVHA